jgi:putative colanic acid biosynthesis glycosyltransferase
MTKNKIIFNICVEGNTGSTGRAAEALGSYLISKGWTSYIAHGRFKRKSKSKTIQIENNFGLFFHGIITRLFDRHGLGSRIATQRLIKQIIKIQPTIIHLHHLHGYYINIELLFKFLKDFGVPVIWTFHDCWAFTGHCAHFDFVECNKWKLECYDCPQKKEYPASFLIDRSRKNFILKKEIFNSVPNLNIVSVSNWLNSKVGESFFKNQKHQAILNGINLELFNPQLENFNISNKYGFNNKFTVLGVASPWSFKKGLFDFIELSKLVKDDVVFVLVGINQKQLKLLPKNIIGIPKTENQSELKDLYVAVDVFMNLSVEETFGLTTAEALACGTPAIVYNATACPEIIDLKTGIVIEKGDLFGLNSAIEEIRMKNKKHYTLECRERATSKFDKNRQLNQYWELIQKLIDKK